MEVTKIIFVFFLFSFFFYNETILFFKTNPCNLLFRRTEGIKLLLKLGVCETYETNEREGK